MPAKKEWALSPQAARRSIRKLSNEERHDLAQDLADMIRVAKGDLVGQLERALLLEAVR